MCFYELIGRIAYMCIRDIALLGECEFTYIQPISNQLRKEHYEDFDFIFNRF